MDCPRYIRRMFHQDLCELHQFTNIIPGQTPSRDAESNNGAVLVPHPNLDFHPETAYPLSELSILFSSVHEGSVKGHPTTTEPAF
jgi:hypothetical protein